MSFSFQFPGGEAFYPVPSGSIEKAEERMGLAFPSELRAFYQQYGYGFLPSGEDNINRILDPMSAAHLRRREEEFATYPDLDLLAPYEKDKLVFFEVNESALFLIELGDGPRQAVYYYGEQIAPSLEDFITAYLRDERFYLK